MIARKSKDDRIFDSVNIILLVLILIIVLYPLYFIIIASFSDPLEVLAGKVFLLPKKINVEAYKMVFRDESIVTGYRNTILYTILGTAINIVMTILAAYPLSRHIFEKEPYHYVFNGSNGTGNEEAEYYGYNGDQYVTVPVKSIDGTLQERI